MKKVLLMMVIWMSNCAPAWATTYYVATTGNDSNAGTLVSPFLTMVKGVSVLHAGDTVYLRAGTYTERLDTNNNVLRPGTSYANAVTISAYPGESVTVRELSGGAVINLVQTGLNPSLQYIIFNGFLVDGINVNLDSTISIGQGANHIRFTNMEITNGYNNGMYMEAVSGGTGFIEVLNSHVHNNGRETAWAGPGTGRGHGIYIEASNNLVDHCELNNNGEYGIHNYSGNGISMSGNTFTNNTIYANNATNRYGSPYAYGYGILMVGANHVIFNNVVHDDVGGISTYGTSSNIKIYNNTIYNTAASFAMETSPGSTGTLIKNNIIYVTPNYYFDQGAGTVFTNNVNTNPQFVNAAGANFHVLAGSNAIDTGATVAEVLVDQDGVARPQGAAYDIGAYEYLTPVCQLNCPQAPTHLTLAVWSSN